MFCTWTWVLALQFPFYLLSVVLAQTHIRATTFRGHKQKSINALTVQLPTASLTKQEQIGIHSQRLVIAVHILNTRTRGQGSPTRRVIHSRRK